MEKCPYCNNNLEYLYTLDHEQDGEDVQLTHVFRCHEHCDRFFKITEHFTLNYTDPIMDCGFLLNDDE